MIVVTALAMAVFAVPLGVAASRLYRDREVNRLERAAARALGSLPASGLDGPEPVRLPKQPTGISVSLYDRSNRLAAGSGPSRGGSEVQEALTGRIADDHDGPFLAVAVPIRDERAVIGAARAELPWDVVADDVIRSWLVMAAFGALAVALTAALALWQSARLAAPIDGLARLAVRLGAGDFTARVATSGVAEIDSAGAALNTTADYLGELLARERAFSADVSHQLNTPLTSLRLSIEGALLGPAEVADRAWLEEVLGELERLQATVSTLLAVARDANPIYGVPVDVGAICEEMARRVRDELGAQGRRVVLDLERNVPPAIFSADVLREILAVLVDNAINHGEGTVTVACRGAGSGVVVEVGDEGAGLANREVIFVRRAPLATGHGIGLALARTLAEVHGGRLELTRAAPHPLFTLALPGAGADGPSA
jgi:signal transduction histidine kinase